jgi:hypothetical protein
MASGAITGLHVGKLLVCFCMSKTETFLLRPLLVNASPLSGTSATPCTPAVPWPIGQDLAAGAGRSPACGSRAPRKAMSVGIDGGEVIPSSLATDRDGLDERVTFALAPEGVAAGKPSGTGRAQQEE